MYTFFINKQDVGEIEIVGAEWPALKGRFEPNKNFEQFKELFEDSNSEDEDLAASAQDEIDTTLAMTLLNHSDLARENVDVFLDSQTAWWQPNSDRYILFYKQNEELYGCYSNFHKEYPITIDGGHMANGRALLPGDEISWKQGTPGGDSLGEVGRACLEDRRLLFPHRLLGGFGQPHAT
jgi:hypothetical protein